MTYHMTSDRENPMQPEIICFGEPLLEFNQTPEDGKYLPGHGGDTSNCACSAARQGAKVGYFGAIGVDPFGDSFVDLWEKEGIDTQAVIRNPEAHTGIYFVTHTKEGHSFSYFRAGSAASRVRPEDVPEEYIRQAKILHVSGISQAISDSACDAVFHAIDLAKKHGVKVSYDTNLRLKLWPLERARAIIHAAIAQCDIALPGLEDAVQLTGLNEYEAIAEFYAELGPSIVALSLGKDGTLVIADGKKQRIPVTTLEAVDATAAGDTFDGAFLARLCAGDDPFAAAEYANAAAALSTQGYGAVAPMPHREAVLSFMAGAAEEK